MNTQQDIDAIKASIEHWKAMKEDPRSSSPASIDCPLCSLYLRHNEVAEPNCDGCPVKRRTEQDACHGSPWSGAYDSWLTVTRVNTPSTMSWWRSNAQEEIEFLESLLVES